MATALLRAGSTHEGIKGEFVRLWMWIDGNMVRLGESFLRMCGNVAGFLRFCAEMFLAIPSVFKNFHFTIDQMYLIGITSIPLVALTSIFTGAVAAWQAAYNFADYVPLRYVGTAVGKSVMLEVGPVLTALVVSGRVGAAMTAELGTMAVTEQLDAMKVLDINPFRFLMAPRLLASMIMLPMLTIFSSFIAILGALAVVTSSRICPPSRSSTA
jgi:phospholipid/cholesterol/gamma-HCH transport system permease protein